MATEDVCKVLDRHKGEFMQPVQIRKELAAIGIHLSLTTVYATLRRVEKRHEYDSRHRRFQKQYKEYRRKL